eukprot:CAMPEP_0175502994 /NCGR_PEP_ID=MMETSP0096-20121207/7607_1 /TAXON_ID=311494 /ORGANISM="Alexandrium monilatum, Strain CCMP3105" /LENGTH=128 /DNA_ID=CAMNT_0016805051 /DNA_START=70 /DNA_END=453 /DNA_ORIENTATION=-
MMRRVALCALVPAASAASAFVTLPGAAPAASHPVARAGSPAGGAAAAVVKPAAVPPLPEDGREGTPAFIKWLGAGLLVGLLMAVSSAPAEASAVSFAPSFSPEKFSIKSAKHLQLCKDNKKYKKKIKD